MRVLVVGPDPLARVGLAAVLGREPDCVVVAESDASGDAASLAIMHGVDVAVWDFTSQGTEAVEWMGDLAEGGCPIVALVPDRATAAHARAGGAGGVLWRTSDGPRISAALRAVAAGLAASELDLAADAPGPQGGSHVPQADTLTPRELQVLGLMADGLPNKALGQRLGISEHTVKFHVNSVMAKLHAQSRTEAVALAIRTGLVPM